MVHKAVDHLVKHLLRTADAKIEDSKQEEQKKRRERKYLANNNKMGERERDDSVEKGGDTGGEKEQEKEKGSSSPVLPKSTSVVLVKSLPSKPPSLEKLPTPQGASQEVTLRENGNKVSLNGNSSKLNDKGKEKENGEDDSHNNTKQEKGSTAGGEEASKQQQQQSTPQKANNSNNNDSEKSENKVNEIHYLIEEFYKQLKFDLTQLLRYGSFNSKRVADMQGLVKQAENEYNQLSHRLLTINW